MKVTAIAIALIAIATTAFADVGDKLKTVDNQTFCEKYEHVQIQVNGVRSLDHDTAVELFRVLRLAGACVAVPAGTGFTVLEERTVSVGTEGSPDTVAQRVLFDFANGKSAIVWSIRVPRDGHQINGKRSY